MPPEARLLAGLAVAMAVVYSATPLAIRVADRFQFYDKPVGYKGHARPTPYLGGAAVMAGFLLALLAVSTGDWSRTLPLVGGMAVLWAVGTVDDRRNIAPGARVAVEGVLAWVLWEAGLGWHLGLGGAADLALTIVWVVAVVNAFNLFDNMDGAASSMALVVSAGVVGMGVVHDDTWLAVAAATLCGACLGFLPHNLASPARIFLGDGGSMPVGFAVAALVMNGSAESVPAWQALVVGLLLVGVPAVDTALVMVSRRRRGISILTGGRDHLTHRTQRRLRTARAVTMALGAVQALVSALALFAISGGATAVVLIVVLYLVAAATAIALLEAQERERATLEPALPAMAPRQRWRPLRPAQWPLAALVVLFGALLGASPFVAGFYEPGKWVPIGLGLLTLATAGAIAKPPRLSLPAIGALATLMGIALWALVSSAWAPSIEQATVEANRNFVLAAILAAAVVLVRTDAMARWLVGGLVAGIGAVALYVIANLLGSDPASLFLGGRLNEPLGYVNAEGTVFLMGFWLCFSLVERRSARLAGLGAGGATLMACVGLLSESRGAALAMAASLVVVIALVPGDPIRRILGLLACAGGLAAAAAPLLEVYHAGIERRLDAGIAHRAGLAICLAALITGLVWAAGVAAHQRLTRQRPTLTVPLRRAATSALAVGLVVVLGAAVISAGRIEATVSNQWATFVHLSEPTGSAAAASVQNRLVSGAGNRYDYWRIAWDAFRDRPIGGVGAGNYDRPYFEARRTAEDVRQPHSLEMQALSELGIVGGLLVAAFILALALGAWRMRRAASASALTQGLMIAGVGSVTGWLVHTSVDWVHLMPGVTGVALAMGAVVLRERGPVPMPMPARVPVAPSRWALRSRALAAAGLAGLALVVAAASLSRQGLADFFRHRASDALAQQPLEAIREANRSLRLDAENPRTYYVKAAALARFNQGDAARAVLQQALAKDPDDFVTWTLLGDLAVRQGDLPAAKRNYQRAAALNPRDAGIRALARDPRQALPGATP